MIRFIEMPEDEYNLENFLTEANIEIRHLRKVREFYEVSKKVLGVGRKIYDLCCGNGLFGFYFALQNPETEVIQVDIVKTNKYKRLLKKFRDSFRLDNCRFLEEDILGLKLEEESDLYALHACGELSDRIILKAINNGQSFSLMPCCQKKEYMVKTKRLMFENLRNRRYDLIVDYVDYKNTKKNKVIIGKKRHLLEPACKFPHLNISLIAFY